MYLPKLRLVKLVAFAAVTIFAAIGVIALLFHRDKHSKVPSKVLGPSDSTVYPIYDEPFYVGCQEPDVNAPRANATIFMLARNSDLEGAIQTITSFELHFNRFFHYPYLFMNDEPFEQDFMNTIAEYISAPAVFVQADAEDWNFPANVEEDWIQESLDYQDNQAIMYGGMRSYHHMCRFLSGKFYKSPHLAKFKWYWRIEPDIDYWCDITYDVFVEMEKHNKVYGFSAFIEELKPTVWSLFRETQAFKRYYNLPDTDLWQAVAKCRDSKKRDPPKFDKNGNRVYTPTAEMDGCEYNLCHFWSNFEIARTDLWHNEIYDAYFEWLDQAGGFWRERWGDAPVHTLGAAMIANLSQIHYFSDIGYVHTSIGHCPKNAPNQIPFEKYGPYDTDVSWWLKPDYPSPDGVGCRCHCPSDVRDTEIHFCFKKHLGPLLNGNKYPPSKN